AAPTRRPSDRHRQRADRRRAQAPPGARVRDDLASDRVARKAEQAPHAPLLPRFALTNAEAWGQSGGVASWLIAQGFGPGALSIAVSAPDSPERVVLLLGALRAGALVVETASEAALVCVVEAGRLV